MNNGSHSQSVVVQLTKAKVARLMLCAMLIAGLAWGAGLAGARSAGANRAPSATPPIVAVIDLEKVINSLDEQRDKTTQLENEFKGEEGRMKALAESAKQQENELAALTGPALQAARAKLRDAVFNLEFQRQLAKRNLNLRGADMLRELYLKVDAAAEDLAKKNGYDLVLVSDEKAPIPEDDEAAARRAMLLKRMMYVNPTLDITNELIQTMNNDYARGK